MERDPAPLDGSPEAVPVTVVLPRALLDLFPGAAREVEMRARCVGDVIGVLEAQWPGMRDRLCDSTPRIRRHINIFVAGRRTTLETPLKAGDRVHVLTAISGG